MTKFDSPIDQLSEVRFGLFSFLGNDAKQLVIEQTSNKFWRYWIVSLQPEFRIIYDSSKYDVVYELRVADIDSDGKLNEGTKRDKEGSGLRFAILNQCCLTVF